jgi:hypothetical protein
MSDATIVSECAITHAHLRGAASEGILSARADQSKRANSALEVFAQARTQEDVWVVAHA